MADQTGPRCGNNPNVRLTPGDRKIVDEFRAYLADRAALRDRIAEALYANDHPGHLVPLNETGMGPAYQESAGAVMAVLRGLTLRELEQLHRANTPPSRPDAPAPVKQRADCTELEWAEQERARFERLYTRESVRADLAEQRADTAARDADIYQQRVERLGEGYTRERKRAERAEAEAEQLRTERAAVCICGHGEQQHFEDACLVCDCGDYLTPDAAREVIVRWREVATRKAAETQPAASAVGQAVCKCPAEVCGCGHHAGVQTDEETSHG